MERTEQAVDSANEQALPTPVTPLPPALTAFVAIVVVLGFGFITHSLIAIRQAAVTPYLALLGAVTIASGRFAIKVPGRPATVSVSEVFVFASVLLFSPEAATLIVAVDGLWTSLLQKDRRLYRALFNVAEPAISTWTAGHVFFAISRPGGPLVGTSATVLAAIAMAAAFFVLNSGLTAVAIGLENRTSAYDIWRRHARYLAANYYAAASLAALAVGDGHSLDVAIVALIVPLLIVSYLAYEEASTRIDEAQRHVTEVGQLYHAATEMLAIAVDTKDQVTHGHIRRVQRQTLAVARALGMTDRDDLKAIEAGALLHDIGKLAVPDYVLNKPSGLTRAEFDTIKKHPGTGARILKAVDFPYPVVPIVRHHHEQWNGRGYPDGLVGAEIPLGARIIAVVDCYDALTSDRPYRARLDVDRAIEILLARKGTFYDPRVVDKFIELIPTLERDERGRADAIGTPPSLTASLARSNVEQLQPRHSELPQSLVPGRARALIDHHTAHFAGAEACLFAFTPNGDALVAVHATSGLCQVVESLHVPAGAGVSGWVAGNRSTIRHADPVLDLGEIATSIGLTSCSSTPVFVAGEVFGALTVYRASDRAGAELASVMGTLAQEVGLVIARQADEAGDCYAPFAVSNTTAECTRSAS